MYGIFCSILCGGNGTRYPVDKTYEVIYTFVMEDNEQKIKRLKQMLNDSKYAVFFGGAGVSTASGIPDFRSPDGLSAKKYAYPFEMILSHEFFFEHTGEFYDYYYAELDAYTAKPNAAHKALAALEADGRIKAVITQNIDGLHQAAGSRKVYELHGTTSRGMCVKCGKVYSAGEMRARRPVPKCDCGGIIKPDVVLYGESLDPHVISGACMELEKADLVIVGGTSLSVYPAAGFLDYTDGDIVVINKTPVASSYIKPALVITGDVCLLSGLV